MITLEKLQQFAPHGKDLPTHAAALEAARLNSTVNTTRRLAHFLGQIYVETAGFRYMVENLSYRDPRRLDAIFSRVHGIDDARVLIAKGPEAIANRVYGNRRDLGNGNEASGDGWRYRGSGYKQLTGLDNYFRMGKVMGIDLVKNPEFAREPETAAVIAFAYWDLGACSVWADNGNTETITRYINGPAKLGLSERREATWRALEIWDND